MAFVSHDGDAILGIGAWTLCTHCGEGTLGYGDERRHAEDCPYRDGGQSAARAVPHSSREPQAYVMTSRGIERADQVRQRQPRR